MRCGRCSQVFNALEALVDLESGLPHRAAGAGLAPSAADGPDTEPEYDIAQPAPKPGRPDLPPQPPAAAAATPTAAPPAAGTTARRAAEPPSPARFSDSGDDGDSAPAPRFTPSFVKSADRAAAWRQPRVRAALALAALVALLGLAAQVGLTYRDLLAARVPETRPWLERACEQLGCTVQAARSIEGLAVESSGLLRVEKSSLYRLQVSLRNRSGIELAVPALDVTLTDYQGRVIARKVLQLSELGATQVTIAAGGELGVQATLQASAGGDAGSSAPALAVAGYTIELFYP